MRKLILGVATSLDGLIEGPNGEFDWCFTDQDYGMTQFLNSIDAIFFGRKSYEVMMKYGGNMFPTKAAYVFSATLPQAQDYKLISDNIVEKAAEIKSAKGKDIWLYGGASLMTTLLKAQLVDELWLSVHPIVLGKGLPLFFGIEQRIKLELIDSKVYNTGLLSVRYKILYQEK